MKPSSTTITSFEDRLPKSGGMDVPLSAKAGRSAEVLELWSIEMNRVNLSTDTPWEAQVGYSRAVRVGNQIFVAGTTASTDDGVTVAVGDAYEQTRFILQKIKAALAKVGAKMTDITRSRMFVTDISRWEEIGKAHGEVFGDIRPAATMVEVRRLVNSDHLVEIEVNAIVEERDEVSNSAQELVVETP